ncbi:MAG: hypothetical protein V1859_02090 [archaeon]
MVSQLKHDRYLEILCDKIKPNYDRIYRNVTLYSETKKNRKIAEVDIMGIKNNYCDVYEVKCSHRIVKARRQLHKVKKHMPNVRNMFFFCGESGILFGIL